MAVAQAEGVPGVPVPAALPKSEGEHWLAIN